MPSAFPDIQTLLFCLVGGTLPSLLWLLFWLREDPHPEPQSRLFLAFLGGMAAVPLVWPVEQLANKTFGIGLMAVFIWAVAEELFKFAAASVTALSSKDDDEPVDPVIFMLTTALGFAALENALYLFSPISLGHLGATIDAGNLRFIGATLLHLVSSSAIGVAMGLAFYRSRLSKFLHILAGLAVAIGLHALFNFLIINSTAASALFAFYGVWLGAIILALFFEKLKRASAGAGN